MSTKPNVGSSVRTPIKHLLLDKLIGQVNGAATRTHWIGSMIYIDATAGTGDSDVLSETSSPEIVCKHVEWAIRHGLPAVGVLIERNGGAFELLRSNMSTSDNVQFLHGDYLEADTAAAVDRAIASMPAPAVFLHIDPNHVDHVGMPRFRLPAATTMLVTLGCNASGIKRKTYAERCKWFDRLRSLLGARQPWHDACLIRLEKDKAQWAYLLTIPSGWRRDVNRVIDKMDQAWPKGVQRDWLLDGEQAFWGAAEYLFLRVDGSEQQQL